MENLNVPGMWKKIKAEQFVKTKRRQRLRDILFLFIFIKHRLLEILAKYKI